MNWKSTIVLVVLAVIAGLVWWKGDDLLSRVAPNWARQVAPNAAQPDPVALTALEKELTSEKLTRIEITPPGGDTFVFTKTGDVWSQPGNWPLRATEVNELVEVLRTLRTRFQPIPVSEEEQFTEFGVAASQKPLVVKVKVKAGSEEKEHTLRFGEPELKPGESPFTRSAYVRVDGANEVLKLGPDVMPVLRRSADSYRRRQLFSDVERVKVAGGATPFGPPDSSAPTAVTLPGESVSEIRVASHSPKVPRLFGFSPWWAKREYTLKRVAPTPAPSVTAKGAEPAVQPDRLADSWAVESPVRDRVDPSRLQPVLAAVPDLWVEEFISGEPSTLATS